jgi:chemotaxis signal transduction protein
LHQQEIQEAPEFENLKSSAPVTGIVNRQGDITMIMDIGKVFSAVDVTELNKSMN